MSEVIRSYQGQSSDTPLPTVAARAARRAIAATRPWTVTAAQTLARWALTGLLMIALASLVRAFIGHSLH